MKSPHLRNTSGKWDTHDLVRRLCHALDIAKQAITHLAAEGYNDPNTPAKSVLPEKVVSETAVLVLDASVARSYPEINTRIVDVAEQLIPHARSRRMMLGLCLEAAVAWDYALAHVCLTRLGFPDRD